LKFLGLDVGVINSDGLSYRVEWANEDVFEEAIEKDLRVWPKGHFEESISSDMVNIDAKKAFFTVLKEVQRRDASKEDIVQVKGHNYAIVDEVDSILIDEARTPLIISGPAQVDIDIYKVADAVVRKLEADKDFKVDEKNRNVIRPKAYRPTSRDSAVHKGSSPFQERCPLHSQGRRGTHS